MSARAATVRTPVHGASSPGASVPEASVPGTAGDSRETGAGSTAASRDALAATSPVGPARHPRQRTRTVASGGRRAVRRTGQVLRRAAVPAVLLAAWAWGSASGHIPERVFPAPWQVVATARDLVASGVLAENLEVSLVRVATGFAIGASLGILLGVVAGLSSLADELLDPTLQMLRTIPFLAVAPLLVLWFGIGELPKTIIIATAATFPLYLNIHAGVRHVDRKVVEAARVFGLRGPALVARVVLPGAVPSVLVGLRVSLSVSLLALIVAELTNAPRGLGALMTSAQQYFQTDVLVVIVAIYALWGLGVDLLVRGLERVLLPYRVAGRAA